MSLRTICTVTALLVGACTLTAADEPKFESKDGRFSAKFPGKAETKPQKAGALDLFITYVETEKEKNKVGFAVIYSDMPADVVKSTPAKAILENGEKGLVNNFKAKVTKSNETVFKANGKDYPARDIVAEKDATTLNVKLILVDNRLFQVFVAGPKELATGKEAEEFLKSFELAK